MKTQIKIATFAADGKDNLEEIIEELSKKIIAFAETGKSGHLVSGYRQVTWETPLTISEGYENCGRGKLYPNGEIKITTKAGLGFTNDITHVTIGGEGEWKNYGFPSGTQYNIICELFIN